MKFKDYYACLGVERGAGAEEIKKAYRRLARQYHPDVASEEGAEERFKEISEAYQTLSDPEKRQAYDNLGRHRPGEDFQPSPEWETRFSRGGGSPQEVDLADLFEQMGFGRGGGGFGGGGFGGGGFSGGGFGGPRGQGTDFPIRGQDVEVATELTLEQAARGTEVAFSLQVPVLGADGRVLKQTRSGRIRVPRGVVEGERLRVPAAPLGTSTWRCGWRPIPAFGPWGTTSTWSCRSPPGRRPWGPRSRYPASMARWP